MNNSKNKLNSKKKKNHQTQIAKEVEENAKIVEEQASLMAALVFLGSNLNSLSTSTQPLQCTHTKTLNF